MVAVDRSGMWRTIRLASGPGRLSVVRQERDRNETLYLRWQAGERVVHAEEITEDRKDRNASSCQVGDLAIARGNTADSETLTNGILMMLVGPATPFSFLFPVSGVFVRQVSTQLKFVTVLA